MVALVLRSDDELLHVTLYSWFISEGMEHKLVEVYKQFRLVKIEGWSELEMSLTHRFSLLILKSILSTLQPFRWDSSYTLNFKVNVVSLY